MKTFGASVSLRIVHNIRSQTENYSNLFQSSTFLKIFCKRHYSSSQSDNCIRLPLPFCRNYSSFNLFCRTELPHHPLSNSKKQLFHLEQKAHIYSQSRNSSSITKARSDREDNPAITANVLDDSSVVLNRFIYVKTLENLYEDVHPGIVLDTAYGDSKPDADFDPSAPVILALHDTPGSHTDVVSLLSFFAKLGCRTICPTFPGHGNTRGIMRNFDHIFSQATIERATFVHDFLADLSIKRVDVVIAVGASSYTAMALCTHMAEFYKSMVLVSPWPLTQPRFVNENKTWKFVHELWEMVYLRPLVRLFIPAVNMGTATTTDEKITSCYLVENIDFGEAEGFALTAAMRNIPRLVAYGEKDALVSKEHYEKFLVDFGINQDQVSSNLHQLASKGKLMESSALVFPNSGYDILSQQQASLCAYILPLVQHFHPTLKI